MAIACDSEIKPSTSEATYAFEDQILEHNGHCLCPLKGLHPMVGD